MAERSSSLPASSGSPAVGPSPGPEERPGWLAERVTSFACALRGIAWMLRSQPNSWIHAAATVAVVVAGFGLEVSRTEWLALLLAIGAVWTAEAMNTAIEELGDAVSRDFHPRIGRAKDVAAGAVLLAAFASAVVGLVIFVPRLLARLGGAG